MPKLGWVLVLPVVLLAACSATPPAPKPQTEQSPSRQKGVTGFNLWRCAGQTPLQWRYVDESAEQIDLRIGNDDIMHRLSKRPAGLHSTFSDGLLAFELRDQRGRLYRVPSGKHVDYDCKAQ